ncbi:MAG TPA: (d)CMP kinase [Crenotrichaceae bacterium]|nr:(d)CMP kinase [Crenotrichaceae bacterium]
MSDHPVLTIDGPGGAGKGTVSRLVASKLGWHYLESGAMYRALAVAASKHGINLDDTARLAEMAVSMNLRFECPRGEHQVLLDDIDITDEMGQETCGNVASIIASNPVIREALVEKQRRFKQPPGLVAEGRDMGTVIFPDAKYKIFLTASVEERARRRYLQLKQLDNNVSLDKIRSEIEERDRRDMNRSVAPLVQAGDALLIDSTDISIESVVDKCIRIIN